MILEKAPMGWNSWDCWGAAVKEETVRANADYMAEHLKEYGWEYVVVDIQWSSETAKNHEYEPFTDLCMDEYSRLMPAVNRFPSAAGGRGFAPLAEYVHSLGLKFGIHIMRGIPRQAVHRNCKIKGTDKTARQIAKTDSICHWNTDMYGVDPHKDGAARYYASLFELYASWGVDFIKVDDICRELPHEEEELIMLSNALHSCGRDMVLSLSPGPALLEKAELYKEYANMWRITDDFWDKWELLYNMFERAEKWAIHTGAGHFPDADMLPLGAILQDYGKDGHTKFTADEQKTMMNLWCIFRSPLFMGGDMEHMDDLTLSLLTDKKLLEMHSSARHSHQIWRRTLADGNEYVLWYADKAGGGCYAAIFNLGDKEGTVTVPLSDCEISGDVTAENITDGGTVTSCRKIAAALPAHGSKVYLIK